MVAAAVYTVPYGLLCRNILKSPAATRTDGASHLPRFWVLFTRSSNWVYAAIGGKDSMSGSFKDMDVPPTLVAFAVTAVDVRRVVSPEFKGANNRVLLLPLPRDDQEMPDFAALKNNYARVHDLIQKGKILAAQSLHGGGLAEAVSKMSFGNRIGMAFNDTMTPGELFSPAIGSLVLEVPGNEDVEKLFSGLAYRVLGKTIAAAEIKVNGLELAIAELAGTLGKTAGRHFPHPGRFAKKPARGGSRLRAAGISGTGRPAGAASISRPRVLITTFPGTNNEYDMARAFAKAGGVPDIFVFRNQCAADIEESIGELDKKIHRSQMLVIPGGFSAGDEPDGSGKFITAVFRHPRLRDAVHELINKKDGLILGVCNGFQALIKLGLLPYGEIRDLTAQSPTLTFNQIGRLVSRPIRTKLVSTLSPWFSLCRVGDIHTIPVAHAEGRFVAPAATLELLFALGQVATQYVDFEGRPAADSFFNPNGSMLAIEAISSPDGRILGKMAHSDRTGKYVLQNIPGNKDPENIRFWCAVFPIIVHILDVYQERGSTNHSPILVNLVCLSLGFSRPLWNVKYN